MLPVADAALNHDRKHSVMTHPEIIYADTDLVCGEEEKEGHERYIRADLVTELIEIVEGVRSERWSANGVRLKDTSEWCKLYVATRRD